MKILNDHQIKAMEMLKRSLKAGHKRPLLQMPTGAGKTVLASAIVQGALNKGNRVIFCVPRISLIDQTVRSFWQDGVQDVGVIQANHELTNSAMPIQVASIQTLNRRKPPHADIVIVDEAHLAFRSVTKWMKSWDATPFVGLSATPWTKGLGKIYDDLLVAATTQQLIDGGFLSDFQVYAPSHPDLSGIKTVAGDYHEGQLGDRMDTDPLVADIVDTWRKRGEGRPTLVFAVNRAHAKHIQEQFLVSGVSAEYIDAYTDLPEREAIAKRFHDGDVQVVCNVGVLTTGIDWDVRCIVLARPTKSKMLFVQMIGRGLRTAPGKDHCLILDHSDTHTRLGFVTDIHQDELDTGEKAVNAKAEPKVRLPKECPSCAFLKPVGSLKCPACGFRPVVTPDVEQLDGELTLLTKKPMKSDKQRVYSQLAYIAMERGYSKGWIAHSYRDLVGVWPRGMDDTEFLPPSPEIRDWVAQKIQQFMRKAV